LQQTPLLAGRSILVVEDETLILIDVTEELQQAGAMVTSVRTLQSALDAVRQSNFDAAVLDYRLPDGKSTQICEELQLRNIPFVIHSGYESLDDVCAKGVKVEKPASPSDLIKALVEAIG